MDVSCAAQHQYAVSCKNTAHAVHHSDFSVANLPFVGFAAQLNDSFDELTDAAGARRVTVR